MRGSRRSTVGLDGQHRVRLLGDPRRRNVPRVPISRAIDSGGKKRRRPIAWDEGLVGMAVYGDRFRDERILPVHGLGSMTPYRAELQDGIEHSKFQRAAGISNGSFARSQQALVITLLARDRPLPRTVERLHWGLALKRLSVPPGRALRVVQLLLRTSHSGAGLVRSRLSASWTKAFYSATGLLAGKPVRLTPVSGEDPSSRISVSRPNQRRMAMGSSVLRLFGSMCNGNDWRQRSDS